MCACAQQLSFTNQPLYCDIKRPKPFVGLCFTIILLRSACAIRGAVHVRSDARSDSSLSFTALSHQLRRGGQESRISPSFPPSLRRRRQRFRVGGGGGGLYRLHGRRRRAESLDDGAEGDVGDEVGGGELLAGDGVRPALSVWMS